jgi:hypothetical protein
MAKVKGVCHNYDNCDMAADKVVQEVEKSNFVCEECGKPLYPVEDKKGVKSPQQKRLFTLIGLISGALIVVVGITCGIIFGIKSSKQKTEQIRLAAIEQARLDSIAQVEADSLTAVKLAEEQAAEAARLEAEAAEAAEAARLAEEQGENEKNQSSATGGSIDYGKWSGSWKNGSPHGTGTMTYTKQHLIDKRDPQKRMAVKGDYIIGEFANGKLVQGVWYDSNNNVKGSIIIGM